MKSILKIQSIALVLLLLCSVCVVPAMAGTMATSGSRVVEDGVHLVKFDDSPTILDDKYYDMKLPENVIVDGDQYYWVRIGSEKAAKLSSNDIAKYLCYGGFVVATAAVGMYAGAAVAASETTITTVSVVAEVGTGGATFISVVQKSPDSIKKHVIEGLVGAATGVLGIFSGVCDRVATYFVNSKYQVRASDGTILIGISKNNTDCIQELKKDGIDIGNLRHLKKDGSGADNRKTDL